jgi:hypothetical protein
MGRKPDPFTKVPFAKLWNEIRLYHKQQHWDAPLRVAANLIGFWQFPVGWCWTEYKSFSEHDGTNYEAKAKQQARCGLGLPRSTPDKSGSEANQNGRRYRRRLVERALLQLIERKVVRVYRRRRLYSEGKNEPDFVPLGQIEPNQELRKLSVERSTIGFTLSMNEYRVVDALDLMDGLASQIETRGRPLKHNWLKFERWCRDEIEATGNPKSGASLADKGMIAYSKDLPKNTIPNKTKAEEITSKLIREYADPKMI